MALDDIVSVSITRRNSAVTQAEFSVPLVLSCHARFADRMRSVASVAELEALGFCSDDAAHKDVTAIFAQPSPPSTVKIGRRNNSFTQSVRLTPDAANSTEYAVEVDGVEATYTSDATASVAEICAGVTAAVNALADADAIVAAIPTAATEQSLAGADLDGVTGYRAMSPSRRLFFTLSNHADFDAGTAVVTGKDSSGNTITEDFTIPNGGNGTVLGTKRFARVTGVVFPAGSGVGGEWTLGTRAPMTATDGTTHVDLAGVAGQVSTVEVTEGDFTVEDRTSDPGIVADFTACVSEDPDFYAVLIDSQSSAEIRALATTIESHAGRYKLFANNADTACCDADSITDVMYLLKDLLRYRTTTLFHPVVGERAAAGWVGGGIAYAPGSITWQFREIAGVASYTRELDSASRAAILAKNGNLMETVLGRTITVGGKTAGGEWIDIIHGLDWHHARIGERVFAAFVAAQDAKIAYTDAGIHTLETELRAQMAEAERVGLFEAGWTTTVPLASSLTAAQKRTRTLPSVTFAASPAGAIHAVQITGTVAG
jgi:hypothetical protein